MHALHGILLGAFALLTISSATARVAQPPTSSSSRIVGGLPANDVNIPYIVSLVTYGYHICGGSILNERTVLTAAHCLAQTSARLLKVHAGAKTRSLDEGIVVAVQAMHYHEGWSMMTMDYDIGVVRMAVPLVFSEIIQPIRLPQMGDIVRDGSIATVAGWGFTSVMGPGSDILRYARVPIINQGICRRLLGTTQVTERMICAGYSRGGVDACQMDSGGPLVDRETLIGIVSWGVGCALPNRPGVYARVQSLLPWLQEIMVSQYNEII